MRIFIWGLSASLIVAVCLVVAVWAVLFVPAFSQARSALVSDLLTEQLGQPVIVEDDVGVVLSKTAQFIARGVRIPSENIPDTQLAELQELSFDLNMLAVLDGRFDLDNIVVRNLSVNLLRLLDGTTSWSEREARSLSGQSTPEKDVAQGEGILSFLKTKTALFEDIQLVVQSEETGFEFEFVLENYTIDQIDGEIGLELVSSGTVNSEPFSINGYFPKDAPFTLKAELGSIRVSYDGTPSTDPEDAGYDARLNIEVAQLDDILSILKLNGSVEGNAVLDAAVVRSSDAIALRNVDANIALETGQRFALSGDVVDLLTLNGFDLEFLAEFFPDDAQPQPAREISDLKVTGVTILVGSESEGLDFDDVSVRTNAFQREFQEIGPIAFKRIRRTEDGGLAIDNISVRAGPPNAPLLAAEGSILNVLQLKELDFSGSLAAPASLVLGSMRDDVVDRFGGLNAEFALDDTQGLLGLRKLSVSSVDTDIWDLSANITAGDIRTLDGLDLDLELGIEDVGTFLEALNVAPVEAGRVRVRAALDSKDEKLNGDVFLSAGISEAQAIFAIDHSGDRLNITTELTSDTLSETDVRNVVQTFEALNRLGKSKFAPLPESVEAIPLQPLVLPQDEGLVALVNVEKAIAQTDVRGRAEFKKVIGIEGVSTVSSDFSLENGQATLGPVEAALSGGSFRFQAQMDMINSPETVSLTGATTGWQLSDILKEAGIGIDADGLLSGSFSIAGNRTSVQTFVNTMVGSASLEMSSGRIATSLLELAGLGIFPWLFSEELRRGYTTVTCVAAPVTIRAGEISFDQVVAETSKVQVVARGLIDWNADRIDLRAEPRRVGSPLSRSAVPVNVTGRLSDPEFGVELGGSRSTRADGANRMPENRKPCVPDIYQLQ